MDGIRIREIQWRRLLITFAFWAIAEVYLSMIGLDDYVDYGEFIFAVHEATVFMRKESQYQPYLVERRALLHPVPASHSLVVQSKLQ